MVLSFKRNESNKDIYDLTSGQNTNLLFVRLSKPIKDYLNKNGAKYVIESWFNGKRIFFSGLIQISKNRYKGNHKSFSKRTKIEFIVTLSNDLENLQIIILKTEKEKTLQRT